MRQNNGLNVVDQVVGGNLNGTGGDDLLIGGSGRGGEIISGAGGDDIIQGNGGFDFIGAGSGNDTIVVAADDGAETGILDFAAGSDRLDFSDLNVNAGDVQLVQSDSLAGGTDVIVDGAQTVNIQNLQPGELDIGRDFIFGGNDGGNQTVVDASDQEKIAEGEEVEPAEAGGNSPRNTDGLNVVDQAVGGNLNGTGGDDLLIANGELVSPLGGDDVISVNGVGNSVILQRLNDGNDTIVLENDGATARVSNFQQSADLIDLSALNVDNLGDLDIDSLDGIDVASGTIVRAGDAEVRLLDIDPDALNDDDFVFADDDAAVA